MDAAPLPLPHLDAVELASRGHPRAGEAVVEDFAVRHPDGEDGAAGDAAFHAGCASLPAAAGVDELAVVDLRLLHAEGADAAPQRLLDPQVVQVQVCVEPAEDRPVQLRAVQRHVGDGDAGGVSLERIR